jgi:hypothetical protein
MSMFWTRRPRMHPQCEIRSVLFTFSLQTNQKSTRLTICGEIVFMEFNNSRRRLVDLCKYTAGDWRSYETDFGAQPRPLRCRPCSGGVCRSFWPEISDRRASSIQCRPNGRLDLFRHTLVLHIAQSGQFILVVHCQLIPLLDPMRKRDCPPSNSPVFPIFPCSA